MAKTKTQVETRPTRRPRVDLQRFLMTYEKYDTIDQIAKELGMSPASVATRASKYRNPPHNIPLSEKGRVGGPKLDVNKAFEILAEVRGVSVEEIKKESQKLATTRANRRKN